jgi:hypothetical protein
MVHRNQHQHQMMTNHHLQQRHHQHYHHRHDHQHQVVQLNDGNIGTVALIINSFSFCLNNGSFFLSLTLLVNLISCLSLYVICTCSVMGMDGWSSGAWGMSNVEGHAIWSCCLADSMDARGCSAVRDRDHQRWVYDEPTQV